ncbi:tetratricopeptide repeat protein, partial [Escherichia coli]
MRKFTLNIFTLSLGLAVMPMVEAAPTAQQQLLEQVRLGEATHREDLVQQSLYRLELIDPNNPDVVAARFRSLLRQGDIDGAQKQLDRLSQLAPSSNAYKSSRTTMLLSTPDGRQALQQARLQATTGHAEEAVASYNKLFNGAPPEGDIAVEYWSTVAKIPARRGEAINQLKRINADAPGNTGLQNNLALLLFSSDRRDEGFAVLEQMAKSNAGREGASKIWYGQIKDMPVSDASVSALKKYLSIFSDGDSVAAAQSQLAEQQKQLADPAFRARAQGLAAVDSGMAGKAIPELQQAVRANPKDSEALGALGQAYSQKGDRANAVANLEKALALDPHSSNNDKWNSL